MQKKPRKTQQGRAEVTSEAGEDAEEDSENWQEAPPLQADASTGPGGISHWLWRIAACNSAPMHCKAIVLTTTAFPAGAKLQERISDQFNFDITRFAKIAEESKSQAGQGSNPAPKPPTAKQHAAKPIRRDWNAQVRESAELCHVLL